MIDELIESVRKVDHLVECDSCGRYFAGKDKSGASNVILSDILPKSKFCSAGCRNEAENAAEEARRTETR